ncbi:MAG: T9SS type A sorting domain-containing protein, partial [Bacteroidia bacterium]
GPSIRWVSYLPVSDGMVYLVSTSTGLYATDTLNGLNTTWVRQAETTIGAVVCDMTDVRVSDGTVIVGTHANGIYSATITSVNDIVTVRNTEQPELFTMNLFPNPASDEVTLSLHISKDGEVVVSILDELGRLVRSERKRFAVGEIQHRLTTNTLSTGLYYVRVETSAGAQTKTLILAR